MKWKHAQYGLGQSMTLAKGLVTLRVAAPMVSKGVEQTYYGAVFVEARTPRKDYAHPNDVKPDAIKLAKAVFRKALAELEALEQEPTDA